MVLQGADDVAEAVFRLTPMQMRMWGAIALTGESSAYHIPLAWKISGELRVEAFRQALCSVSARHAALRTLFHDAADGPFQRIDNSPGLVLEYTTMQDEGDEDGAIANLQMREASRPFDLSREFPARALLVQTGRNTHVFFLTLHHLIADGWSVGVLLRDLGGEYERAVRGHVVAARSQAISYGEYLQKHLQFGRAAMANEKPAHVGEQQRGEWSHLDLAGNRSSDMCHVGRGAWMRFELPLAVSSGINELARRTESSVFSVVSAAIIVMLARYTGESQVCIGYPVANREDEQLRDLVGCLINTLPLHCHVGLDNSFDALVRLVRKEVKQGKLRSSMENSGFAGTSGSDSGRAGPYLPQVIINQNANYEAPLSIADLNVEVLPRVTHLVPFELAWIFTDTAGATIGGRLEYNADLFDRATIARMAGHFRVLMEAVVANPAAKLKDLPLLTVAERQQLLVDWNATRAEYPQETCIHELFEEQAAKDPDAVAVVCESQQLTYGELNARANQVAHCLRELGVKPDTLVAICVERSLELVVGLLGILKAGGAYVPLDPHYPAERLAYMVEDAAARVVVTQAHLRERLPGHGGRIVCLDAWEEAGLAQWPVTNPEKVTQPLHLAYCIYTSGSTGRPKGVLVAHRSLLNLVSDWKSRFPMRSNERFSFWTSFGFDVSLWEWLLPLTSGGSLAIPDEETRLNPAAFLEWAGQWQVTSAYLPPHIARALPDLRAQGMNVPSRILVGVEPLNERVLSTVCSSASIALANGYGPTEATVYSTIYADGLDNVDRNIPIGRPISNTQIYLLDANLQLVPVGAAGELYIGGVGLARGYLNQPELTAEKFIPNPYGEPGSRLYGTGDLARRLPDGNIVFLGRIDDQVKIRGFRIELGEIEAAMLRHTGVREAAVAACEDSLGNKQLVGYVVARQVGLTVNELRMHLQQSLPEYMVPSAWVQLAALPLNANGKLDRKALAKSAEQWTSTEAVSEQDDQADLEPTCSSVMGILRDLLPDQDISPNDDLFTKGFHSLLLIKFIAKCREQFGVSFRSRDIARQGSAVRIAAEIKKKLELE